MKAVLLLVVGCLLFFLIFLVFELTTLGTVIGGPKTDLQIEKLLKVLPTVKHSSSSDSLGVVCPEGMKDIGAGVWMMPPPSHDPDFQWLYLEEKGVPLFVRECVRTLCDEILLPSLASGEKRGFVVTGTPGIGKSVLTNWLVACTLSLFPDRPILLCDWQSPKYMQLITKDGSVHVIDDEWFVRSDKRLVYLAADTGGDPKPRDQLIHAGFAVVTASPAAAPKEFLKHSPSMRTLLPPWTWEECEAVFQAIQAMEPPPERHFPSRDEFERRFKFAGGIPRCLFGPQELSDRYEEGVTNAISNLDSTQRMDANFDMRDVIHKLLHVHPKDPQEAGKKWDFIHLSYDFPTEDVRERISTKIQELNKIDAQRSLTWFLGSGLKFPSMQILVGDYFEKCAHDIISSNDSSSKHTIQQLLDTTTPTTAATTTTSVQFLPSKKEFCSSFLESDLEEGVYYQPTSSNHPVADSWLVQTEGEEESCGSGKKTVVYLFQMTVQSSGHPLKTEKLTSFVNHCLSTFSSTGGCIIRLVFVIPTQQSQHYQKSQKATTTGSSPLPSKVEQWKMEIYLPELNGKSFP